MDHANQHSSSQSKEPTNNPVPFTLEDLERKLASSSINSETLTVDPTQLLSISLINREYKENNGNGQITDNGDSNSNCTSTSNSNSNSNSSEKLGNDKPDCTDSQSDELPPANYDDNDTDDLSVSKFFAPPVPTATTTATEPDLDIDTIDLQDFDIEPLPISLPRQDSLSCSCCSSSNNQRDRPNSLLDPAEYQHIFDEEYLADFVQDILGTEGAVDQTGELGVDLIQAFAHLDIVTDYDPQPQPQPESQPEPQSHPQPQDIPFQGLGNAIYCLPCTPGAEDFPFDFGDSIDIDPAALEKLRQVADLDFDQDGTFSQEELQSLLEHVMQGEQETHQDQVALNAYDTQQDGDEGEDHDQGDEHGHGHSRVQYQVSNRQVALELAEPMLNAFYKNGERKCFGHKDKIFGIAMSPCGNYFASASQDSTICIWDVERNKLLSHLEGSKDHECLRVAWASDSWGRDLIGNNHVENENDKPFKRSDGDLVLAMAGAEGVATIWKSVDGAKSWKQIGALDHTIDKKKDGNDSKKLDSILEEDTDDEEKSKSKESEPDSSEIYSLQFIDKWYGLPSFIPRDPDSNEESLSSLNVIMTSSEDFIHIWQHCPSYLSELEGPQDSHSLREASSESSGKLNLVKIMDIKFTHLEHGYGGVFVHLNSKHGSNDKPDWSQAQSSNIVANKKAFGGDRNPDNLVYVFDAVQCPANNLVGAALSDGTLRLVNGRGICVTILQLPGCQSHLTSFAWDTSGYRLASCVATGHVILWDIDYGDGKGSVQPVCRAVLEGGHNVGRPLFGASFFGGANEVR